MHATTRRIPWILLAVLILWLPAALAGLGGPPDSDHDTTDTTTLVAPNGGGSADEPSSCPWCRGEVPDFLYTNPIRGIFLRFDYDPNNHSATHGGVQTASQLTGFEPIEVKSNLRAKFATVGPTQGAAPFFVQFADQSTGDPAPNSWFWEFGDGTTSSLQHPTHFYAVGTWSVTLTVGNGVGEKSKTYTDYITAF